MGIWRKLELVKLVNDGAVAEPAEQECEFVLCWKPLLELAPCGQGGCAGRGGPLGRRPFTSAGAGSNVPVPSGCRELPWR